MRAAHLQDFHCELEARERLRRAGCPSLNIHSHKRHKDVLIRSAVLRKERQHAAAGDRRFCDLHDTAASCVHAERCHLLHKEPRSEDSVGLGGFDECAALTFLPSKCELYGRQLAGKPHRTMLACELDKSSALPDPALSADSLPRVTQVMLIRVASGAHRVAAQHVLCHGRCADLTASMSICTSTRVATCPTGHAPVTSAA